MEALLCLVEYAILLCLLSLASYDDLLMNLALEYFIAFCLYPASVFSKIVNIEKGSLIIPRLSSGTQAHGPVLEAAAKGKKVKMLKRESGHRPCNTEAKNVARVRGRAAAAVSHA